MSASDSRSGSWVMRAILWLVALFIIITLAQKVLFRKVVEQKVNCLDRAATAQAAATPLAAVDKYAACVTFKVDKPDAKSGDLRPPRCRYAGTWAASRGNMVYHVTLEPDGRFLAEPASNTPPGATNIAGAWSLAGDAMVWVYDSGPVWPPDVNLISAATSDAFTLSEVNGTSTRYTLLDQAISAFCKP